MKPGKFEKPMRQLAGVLLASLLLGVVGCGGGGGTTTAAIPPVIPGTDIPTPAIFTAATAPAKLSAWKLALSDGQALTLQQGVLPYSMNTSLFSDYAHKLRTLWIPEGSQIGYVADGPLQFPVGAILTKTFFYPKAQASAASLIGAALTEQRDGGESVDLVNHRLIETRLMVREPSGLWGAVTYVWDADQKDATLVRTGQNISIELVPEQGTPQAFTYAVPTDSQCVLCHKTNVSTGTFEAIGPKASNLNRDYMYASGTANQLDKLAALNMLSGYLVPAPRMVVWNDPAVPLADRARAYLDVNCSSCHSAAGRAAGTSLWLGTQVTAATNLGICKPPVGGQQNRQFAYDVAPGNAEASFLYFRISNYRINASPPSVAMPELGRHVFHAEGNALVRDWINALTLTCTL
jgi:uncharacterized repeat protein (TIGR03806 family)